MEAGRIVIPPENLKFFDGVKYFFKGLSWLFRHPKYLILGLLPSLLASLIILGGVIGIFYSSSFLIELVTSWASSLYPWVASALHVSIRIASIAGGLYLGYLAFTALSLALGDPIYSKISSTITNEAGYPSVKAKFWYSLKDALILFLKGLAIALLAFTVGLIPVIGVILAFGVTWSLAPLILTRDLLNRAIEPLGFFGPAKANLTAAQTRSIWGFGVIAQFLLSIPIVAVFIMPLAVASSSILATELIKNSSLIAE